MAIKDWWIKLRSKPIGDIIKHKHRFVVMDTDTFKEKLSFQLSGINLFVTVGITIIVLIVLTTVLIAFTPLREYIPGYTDNETIEQTYHNAKKIDSLETVLTNQEWLIATLQAVMRGETIDATYDSILTDSSSTLAHLGTAYRRSKEDSLLRLEVEAEDNRYEVKNSTAATPADNNLSAATHLFYPPVKGNIINSYNSATHHYGVDIAAATGQPVSAAYSGTVILAGFAADEGHVIALQHPAGIITIYRNNSALLKKQGDIVRAGEPIAYVGAGTNRDLGSHLHLEVWVNGTPVNPQDYISF